ncbi:MAG: excinuclease ABC subunit UvrC [bacterium]|nr:excinuclease ABC subunit UvrC [bacterium]
MDLKKTVQKLPTTPGVYIYRNAGGKIIYIGKAINLRARVRSYFQDSPQEPKTQKLVRNIATLEHMKTGSEIEALILEAELIKRYKPRFNIIWRDDKNYIYIKITNEDYPQVSLVRQIVDDKAKYIGPFVSAGAVRGLLRYIRKIFMFRHCENLPQKVCLQYSIGNCSGPCEKFITKVEYKKSIRQMEKLFQGKTKEIEKEFKREMKLAAKGEDFEKAALYRNRLMWLKKIKTIELGEEERDLKRDKALVGLRDALNLGAVPKRIECYDISNIFGKAAVGSMVVFVDGIPEKNHYRRFEIKTVDKISDTDMIREVLGRRFKKFGNITKPDDSFSQIPDLLIIDGGKGQYSAAEKALAQYGLNLNLISLAKQREEIFRRNPETGEFYKTMLEEGSESLYLVQRIRDEAHRFAITYHRSKRGKEMAVSNLDVVDGIGPKTKKVLLKTFGSVENVRNTSVEDLSKIVGEKLAKKIKETL